MCLHLIWQGCKVRGLTLIAVGLEMQFAAFSRVQSRATGQIRSL